ncbi:MAG TPA: epoxyqueuosine reductase [Dehalococcoidia bacterium]|nr:epoxyqueuosine reductase [Dehalococcoidia bacterium]
MASRLEERIIEKAKELGADLVGIASIEPLKDSPSHYLLSTVGRKIDGIGGDSGSDDPQQVQWPTGARTALIIAVAHPKAKPELDWSHSRKTSTFRGNSPGNKMLITINKELSAWIERTEGINTHPLSYSTEEGGIYFKDAAVLAGLGCIGKNNLLITPEYGPRVRLRGMLLEAELETTGTIDYDPFKDCMEYCRRACPQEAFNGAVSLPKEIEVLNPPARDAFYRRSRCMVQMYADWKLGQPANNKTTGGMDKDKVQNTETILVKYCRQCELACPEGNPGV